MVFCLIRRAVREGFGGSLNAYMEHKQRDLISGILGKGEIMFITGNYTAEVAFYMATSIRKGCWDRRWRPVRRSCKVTLFADKNHLGKIAKTKIPTGVDVRSGNIPLADAKQLVRECGLVIFASQDMFSDKSHCHELLKFCMEQEVSSIVFSEKADAFVSQVAGRFYELNCQFDDAVRQYTFGSAEAHFGVSFTLTMQGQLASCRDLSETELNKLCNRQDVLLVANGVDSISNLSGEQIHNTLFCGGLS